MKKYLIQMIRWWFGWRIRRVTLRAAAQRAQLAAVLAPTWAHRKNIYQLGKLARRGQAAAAREHQRRLILGRFRNA